MITFHSNILIYCSTGECLHAWHPHIASSSSCTFVKHKTALAAHVLGYWVVSTEEQRKFHLRRLLDSLWHHSYQCWRQTPAIFRSASTSASDTATFAVDPHPFQQMRLNSPQYSTFIETGHYRTNHQNDLNQSPTQLFGSENDAPFSMHKTWKGIWKNVKNLSLHKNAPWIFYGMKTRKKFTSCISILPE